MAAQDAPPPSKKAPSDSSGLVPSTTSTTSTPTASTSRRLGVVSLALLIFFQVSGGPWGMEEIIGSAGPCIGLFALVLFPWIWSLPMSMIYAELFATFPFDGSAVSWVCLALGKPMGFLVGSWSLMAGIVDNALYPCLVADTLGLLLPHTMNTTMTWSVRVFMRVLLSVAFMIPTLYNLERVSQGLLYLMLVIVVTFLVLTGMSVPRIDPANWMKIPDEVHWGRLLSILFWNYSGFDSAGSFAGEIQSPMTTYPRAMVLSIVLIAISNAVPLIAVSGVNQPDYSTWTDGSFSIIAYQIGGVWLSSWFILTSVLGNFGMYIAKMMKNGFLLAGMADVGMAPAVCARREEITGSPTRAIYLSLLFVVLISGLEFHTILSLDNFFYALTSIVQIIAATSLRFSHPDIHRPFQVPLSKYALAIVMMPPLILGVVVMCTELVKTPLTFALNATLLCLSFLGYFLVQESKFYYTKAPHTIEESEALFAETSLTS